MNRYEEQLSIYARQTNDALRERLHYQTTFPQMAVIDAMRYSLLDAGKRLRATLVLEFARLGGATRESALPLACAIEMVHAYSLIHDDLPCMDDDDFRRGKPSCHKRFGEANALLAGDGLLTLAFETVLSAPISDAGRVKAVRTLSEAAGIFGMIGGQVIDLASEGQSISAQTLENLYALKTGSLLRAAAQLGCIACDGETAAADAYARAFGMAFQITDDILDVTGNQETLGKPIGSDLENLKTTYVTLFGEQGARDAARAQLEQAKQSLDGLSDNGFLLWLADMVLTRDH